MTSAADPAAAGDRRNASDVAGVIVLAACAIWSLVTAGAHDGSTRGRTLAILAVAAGYASGRILGALLPVAAPCAGALAGLGLAVTAPHTTPGPQITSPLGHSGATAALLILSAGAACCAAWAARPLVLRFALRLLAAGIVVTAAVLGSTTGVVLCTGVLLCSLAAARMRRRALGLAGLALTTALVTGTTWAIAENVLPDGLTAALEGPLTQHRVLLWRDALHLAREYPALGGKPRALRGTRPDGHAVAVARRQAPLRASAAGGRAGRDRRGTPRGGVLLGPVRAVAHTASHTDRTHGGRGPDRPGRRRVGRQRPELHHGDRRMQACWPASPRHDRCPRRCRNSSSTRVECPRQPPSAATQGTDQP